MGLRFKQPGVTLHGLYVYYQPGAPNPFQHSNESLFITAIQEYRLANRLPRTSRSEIMEDAMDQMCQSMPDQCVQDDGTPPIGKMLGNLWNSITTWATKDKFSTVSQSVFDKRAQTCLKCPGGHWRGWQRLGIGQCKKCGCIAGTVSLKLYLPSEKCPANYW